MQQVTVSVPATTSNLGPGFDCLGIALNVHNRITVRPHKRPPVVPCMVREASRAFFIRTGCPEFPFSASVSGEVPVARGLGSSATLRVGVLHALNTLSGASLGQPELFMLAAQLEGHGDNAAPAIFGGFTVTREDRVQCFELSRRLRFVLLVPERKVETSIARQLLPKTIPHATAVASMRSVAAMVAAFSSGEYENLRDCFRDGLHQPYRRKLVPFLYDVITAAENAGALGAFLSGSGSAICAVALNSEQMIARAMLQASRLKTAQTIITRADNCGARVIHPKRAGKAKLL